MSRKEIKAHVRAFRIWREATSVGWDCTARDLADATGMPINTVRTICRKRGWELQPDDESLVTADQNVLWAMARQRTDHARGVRYYMGT